jgi:hypothetical protein
VLITSADASVFACVNAFVLFPSRQDLLESGEKGETKEQLHSTLSVLYYFQSLLREKEVRTFTQSALSPLCLFLTLYFHLSLSIL